MVAAMSAPIDGLLTQSFGGFVEFDDGWRLRAWSENLATFVDLADRPRAGVPLSDVFDSAFAHDTRSISQGLDGIGDQTQRCGFPVLGRICNLTLARQDDGYTLVIESQPQGSATASDALARRLLKRLGGLADATEVAQHAARQLRLFTRTERTIIATLESGSELRAIAGTPASRVVASDDSLMNRLVPLLAAESGWPDQATSGMIADIEQPGSAVQPTVESTRANTTILCMPTDAGCKALAAAGARSAYWFPMRTHRGLIGFVLCLNAQPLAADLARRAATDLAVQVLALMLATRSH